MTARMAGKIAFVTGGGSGIGAATAKRLAEEGATVIVCGRREAPLAEVVENIRAAGGKAQFKVADVSDEHAFVSAIEQVAAEHGRLDVMVNNSIARRAFVVSLVLVSFLTLRANVLKRSATEVRISSSA